MKRLTVMILALVFITTLSFGDVLILSDSDMASVIGKGGKGGGGGGSTYTPPADPDGLTKFQFEEKFAEDSVFYWNGVDFSHNSPDGYSDSDLDGKTDCNDSVIIIETLKNMGYDVPETSIDGLYYNYYTDAGYDNQVEDLYTKNDFDYTASNLVDEEDLKDNDWWMLDEGDLIFIDYD
ncbi:MAG: hypothetical protein ACOCWO_04775, partial [Candidatus Muiribacteriaceae bacterium]